MAFLILIFVGFGFYLVLKAQGLEFQIKKLEKHVRDLEDQLRKLHIKIVNQFPGFLDEGKVPPSVQPAASAPMKAVTTGKKLCQKCWAPLEPNDDFCDQCGSPAKLPASPVPQGPAPVTPPVIPPPPPKPVLRHRPVRRGIGGRGGPR